MARAVTEVAGGAAVVPLPMVEVTTTTTRARRVTKRQGMLPMGISALRRVLLVEML
jgi:hypothetical protein